MSQSPAQSTRSTSTDRRCICNHLEKDHNITETWAPLGCFAILRKRYKGDTVGELCPCDRFHSDDGRTQVSS